MKPSIKRDLLTRVSIQFYYLLLGNARSFIHLHLAGLGEGGQKKLGSSVHQNHGTASLE